MNLDLSAFNQKLKWTYNKDELMAEYKNQFNLFENILAENKPNKFDALLNINKNTLIHGTSFDYDKLQSIKKNGILSGDFIGIEDEFAESAFMADFFRIDKDMSLFEFFLQMNGTRDWDGQRFSPINPLGVKPGTKYIDVSNVRLPFLRTKQSQCNVAFVINGNNDDLKQLQQRDYYRNTDSLMNQLVYEKNMKGFNASEMSAIFIGVPSNLISAIIVGSEIEKDISKMNFIKEEFDVLTISSDGKILHIPSHDLHYYQSEQIEKSFEKQIKSFLKSETMEYKPNSKFVDRLIEYKNKFDECAEM